MINQRMPLPTLLKANVQKLLGGTELNDPIIAISTTDFNLGMRKMPADLRKVVRDSYFGLDSLAFSSGVQLAARANLGGAIKLTMKALGVDTDKLTLRAAVVMPIRTDLTGGAGTGAGLADAMHHGETMNKAGAKAVAPEASVFDWDYYYDHNPDLVAAGIDLAEHWRTAGFNEGRRGSFEFDLLYFRKMHPGTSDSNLLNYWLGTGIDRGDQSSPEFSLQGLLRRNQDLRQAFGTSNRDVFNWWMDNGGEDTGRNSAP